MNVMAKIKTNKDTPLDDLWWKVDVPTDYTIDKLLSMIGESIHERYGNKDYEILEITIRCV